MPATLFQNVKLIDPGNENHGKQADVLVRNGTIEKIGKAGKLAGGRGIQEKEGGSLSPGWVDLRVHLTEPGYEWKDSLKSLAASALAGGFTGILTLPNAAPAVDRRDAVESLLSRTRELPVNFLPSGCMTVGAEGKDLAEMYDMHQGGALAFTDGVRSVEPAGMLLRAIQYATSFGGLVMSLPIDWSISGDTQVNEGPVSTQMGLKGNPALAEEVRVARDLRLLDYFSGKLHLGPLTTSGSIELLKAARKKNPQLSASVTLHHLLFTDKAVAEFDNNYKVYPPLRSEKDRKALLKAVREGWVDVVVSDHQSQGSEEKNVDFVLAKYGMLALESFYALANTELVQKELLTTEALVQCMSQNPRRILGLPSCQILEGAEAELTWFDPHQEWTFGKGDLRSKSSNTPFFGRTFRGRALGTYVKGKFNPAQ